MIKYLKIKTEKECPPTLPTQAKPGVLWNIKYVKY